MDVTEGGKGVHERSDTERGEGNEKLKCEKALQLRC